MNLPLVQSHFPFSAVAGQADFKLALILAAVNPDIGGVLVSGPRGSAKSTLARGLADVLPKVSSNDSSSLDSSASPPRYPLVTLPLGATEEMLVGSLNLQKVLDQQQVDFQEGLLARAHQGILYVDEVNLLPDHLVDLLLDVATSGTNIIERDGISHQHDAKFLLMGTMNPDEGELRSQLQDRFGLWVELTNQYNIDERVEIVQRREQFDTNPKAFNAEYLNQQNTLRERISAARQQLPVITCSQALRIEIAERCNAANVDGLRADLVWYRAALAHAAWEQQDQVRLTDIDAVEEFVLAHRRQSSNTTPPSTPSNSPPSSPEKNSNESSGFSRPESSKRPPPSSSSDLHTDASEGDANSQAGEWGSMSPQLQSTQRVIPFDISAVSLKARKNHSEKIKAADTSALERGKRHTAGAAQGDKLASDFHSKQIDWVRTFTHSAGAESPEQVKKKSG